MSARPARACLLAWAALLVACAGPAPRAFDPPEDSTAEVGVNPDEIPFGLSPDDLGETRLMLGFYSAKTGAGKQEIYIHGSGKVVLFKTAHAEAEPEELEGSLPQLSVVRLLRVLDDAGFLALEEEYVGPPGARRIVRFTSPKREHTVAVDAPELCPEFEHITGAIKLAAGLAHPEALGRAFFRNL